MNRYAIAGVVGLLWSVVVLAMEAPRCDVVEIEMLPLGGEPSKGHEFLGDATLPCMFYQFMQKDKLNQEVDSELAPLIPHAHEEITLFDVITNKDFPQQCLPPRFPLSSFVCSPEITDMVANQTGVPLVPLYISPGDTNHLLTFLRQVHTMRDRAAQDDDVYYVPLVVLYATNVGSDECDDIYECLMDVLDQTTHVLFLRRHYTHECVWIDNLVPRLRERGYTVSVVTLDHYDIKAMQIACNRLFCDAQLPYDRSIAQTYSVELDCTTYYWKSSIAFGGCCIAACYGVAVWMLTQMDSSSGPCSEAALRNVTRFLAAGNHTVTPTSCFDPHVDPMLFGALMLMLPGSLLGAPLATFFCYMVPLSLAQRLYYRLRY